MARSKKLWRGRTDDDMPPTSVRLRIFRAQDGRCLSCTRKLKPGNITLDHAQPLEDGGKNIEENLQLICTDPCSLKKTGAENSRRAKADRGAAAHLGFKRQKSRPMPGSRRSPWKRRMDGSVVRREDDE